MRLSQTVFAVFGVIFCNTVLAVIILFVALVDRGDRLWWPLARLWGRVMLLSAGVRVRFEGAERLAGIKGAILVANHESLADVPTLMFLSPVPVRFVSKHSLFWIPIFGQAMWATGMISVNRSNRAKAIESLDKAAAQIQNGKVVLVFPEGTRSHDGKLQSFKKGGFMLALKSQVPIIPIGIAGTYPLLPTGLGLIRSGPVAVVVGEAIPTAGLEIGDRAALMERVHIAIFEARSRARAMLSTHDSAP